MNAQQKLERITTLVRAYRENEVPGLRQMAKSFEVKLAGPSKGQPPEYWEGRAEGMERIIELVEGVLHGHL